MKTDWNDHIKWYDLLTDDYEEDHFELETTIPYMDYGYTETDEDRWNRYQYELIQAEGAREFEKYWEDDWNRRMAMQKAGINIPFKTIPIRQHGEFLETFERQFQYWFLDNVPQDNYKTAIEEKKDILLLNTKYEEWQKVKRGMNNGSHS